MRPAVNFNHFFVCSVCLTLWTPRTAARQDSLSFTISWSLLKLMSIESVMLSNHLFFLCCPFSFCLQSFSASGSFLMSLPFASSGQSIAASALASVLPMNIQGWFPLVLTSLISLLSKGLSRVFSSTTFQKYQFFDTQPSLWSNSHIRDWLLEIFPIKLGWGWSTSSCGWGLCLSPFPL